MSPFYYWVEGLLSGMFMEHGSDKPGYLNNAYIHNADGVVRPSKFLFKYSFFIIYIIVVKILEKQILSLSLWQKIFYNLIGLVKKWKFLFNKFYF